MSDLEIMRTGTMDVYLPDYIHDLLICPHCSTRRPSLMREYTPKSGRDSHFFDRKVFWASYTCSTCALPISVVHSSVRGVGIDLFRHEYMVYPKQWSPDDAIPDVPKNFLEQANATLSSPDASVVMSGSAVDAMLKEKGLTEGSLYKRIGEAETKGFLTADIAKWAHLVRLNSNNPRHADEARPHMTTDDAKLSIEFAKALAEVLFVLPSKMPEKPDD